MNFYFAKENPFIKRSIVMFVIASESADLKIPIVLTL